MSNTIQEQVEEKLLESYESLYRLAYSYVHSEQDALDIVQESAYRAIKNAGQLRNEAYIQTWLWRIVMNTAVDYLRGSSREIAQEEFREESVDHSYSEVETLENLQALNEKERAVIILRFFEDQKLEEIAQILNENVNTVKTVLYRSLKKLRIDWSEGGLSYGR